MPQIRFNGDVHSLDMDDQAYLDFMKGGDNSVRIELMKRILPRAVNSLTFKQKQYISEYFYNGKNTTEIAEKYGVNRATVSRTICRGLNKVNQLLNIWGYDEQASLRVTYGKRRKRLNKEKRYKKYAE